VGGGCVFTREGGALPLGFDSEGDGDVGADLEPLPTGVCVEAGEAGVEADFC
jgi:hypothetical protein